MDRASPSKARRPIAPLALAGTVLQPPSYSPLPPYPPYSAVPPLSSLPPPAQPAPIPPVGPPVRPPLAAILIALGVMAAGVVVNSPLMGALGVEHRWTWGFLGFWAEVGGLAALLGMLFRQPTLAWVGAGAYFAIALAVSSVVWAGHIPALALIGAVAAWHLRRQERRDAVLHAQGWMQA